MIKNSHAPEQPNARRRDFLTATIIGSIALAVDRISNAFDRSEAPADRSRSTKPLRENSIMTTSYKMQKVEDVDVFYREAGRLDAPVLLLLHGYPTSSHMFRDLIPLLANDYHVIAPDLPGFGNTKAPPRGTFDYSFDHLAQIVIGFTNALNLKKYALYVFDYGAPTGFRVAVAHPERVTAIISQNGNAYEDGLSNVWGPYQAYWRAPSEKTREACRAALSPEAIRMQYLHGADPTKVSPDGYTLDIAYISRPGMDDIQLDLVLDYRTNVASYPAWQAYFREHQPPLLAVWGDQDPFFLPAGAKAYKRDIPDAEVHLLNTGHFALETNAGDIADYIRDFLKRKVKDVS
jgi:pimeloyl-ACP methyl ester carboxylesterase